MNIGIDLGTTNSALAFIDPARAIAEEHFDSDRVLARLVERVGSRS